MLSLLVVASATGYVHNMPVRVAGTAAASASRAAVSMDETILEKALAGELEQEGAENVFMSEVGWATYLDKNAGSSYNMNQRVSQADDGYFTPDVFSSPVDGALPHHPARRRRRLSAQPLSACGGSSAAHAGGCLRESGVA